jgi:DNA-directed RNA polymerase specialized sigma24 family protein
LKADHSSLGDDQYRFHTTQWSVVLLSAQSQVLGSQAALSELYRIYRYPLYAYVRRRGYAPEEAQDLTQGFFLHLLEHKTLGRADPLRGKFRSFLLGSLQNYLLARRSGLARPEARRRSGVCLSRSPGCREPL